MHLRTLDCNPDPQDLLHLEYDPHCVHTPWIEAWAEFDPTLSFKQLTRSLHLRLSIEDPGQAEDEALVHFLDLVCNP